MLATLVSLSLVFFVTLHWTAGRISTACFDAVQRMRLDPHDTRLAEFVRRQCHDHVVERNQKDAVVVFVVTTNETDETITPRTTLAPTIDPASLAVFNPKRGNAVTDAEIKAYNSSMPISCAAMHSAALTYLDAVPIARGFSKAAWRATFNGRPLIVKKPALFDGETAPSPAARQAFLFALRQELKFLIRIARHRNILEYYGGCHSGTVANVSEIALAVEGPLIAWLPVIMARQLGWSARLHLAVQLTNLLELLASRHLIHCDWKADQIALSADLTVKLVDLKSLRFHGSAATPWQSTQTCVHDDECRGECFKWLNENNYATPELACDQERGRCRGLGAPSMIHASVQLLFWPLLSKYRADSPPNQADAFSSDVQALLDGMLGVDGRERWTAGEARAHLERMQERFGAATEFAARRDEYIALVRRTGEAFWQSATKRCASRFC